MRGKIIFFTLGLALLIGLPVYSATNTKPLPRKVLAFYDDKKLPDVRDTTIHLLAEMPLNHLGMDVVYRSIHDPLPSPKEMEGFRGILTWFEEEQVFSKPELYCSWLKKQMNQGRKLVILGETGFYDSDSNKPMHRACENALNALGIKYIGDYTQFPAFLEVTYKDPSMVEFERKLDLRETLSYSHFKRLYKTTKPYLVVKRTDIPDTKSTLVFTSPKGGFAYSPYIYFQSETLNKTHWRLNPFKFFNEAFGIQTWPKPDTTTINGKRIFYTHIDGDGIFNMSQIDRKRFSGEVIYDEILKAYPNLPITASIITGYLNIKKFNTKRAHRLYYNIFKLPNVEVASHGYAHPIDWVLGLSNSRRVTSENPFPTIYDKAAGDLALKIPKYLYDPKQEIVGSINMIQEILQKMHVNKNVELFLWTGFCNPNEAMISLLNENNMLNLNGGDTRFDKASPSYASVYPLGVMKGKHRQVYASNMNENVYTNSWEGPYFGYAQVIETFENTESPIRIKPINIYYHYYSGEFTESLTALKKAYSYALTQNIFPIHASEFSSIVQDSFNTQITPLKDGGFSIQNDGHLRTVRFDENSSHVNMARSKGVLGYKHFQGSLYVFLDQSQEHTIHLSKAESKQPYWIEASAQIQNFSGNRSKLTFSKKGWHKSHALLGGLYPSKTYRIRAQNHTFLTETDKAGHLSLRFPSSELGRKDQTVAIELAQK